MTTSDRLLSVLDLFDLDRPDWAVEEAAAELGLATSTTYRYFASLTASGMLAPFASGRYILGPTIIRYDRLLRLTDPLVSSAMPEMRGIAALEPSSTVVFLCRLIGNQVMCVAQVSIEDPPFAVGYERGRLMPLFKGSASKAILASLPSRHIRSLYRREPESFLEAGLGTNWDEARDALRKIRLDALVVSNGEIDAGMRGVSVPLIAEGGAFLASLNVAGRQEALPPETVRRIGEALREAAPRILSNIRSVPLPSA